MSDRTEGEELFSDDPQREDMSENSDSLLCVSTDEELSALLERWKAPAVAFSLDGRVMAAYRKQVSGPLWKRAVVSSVRVPLPAAAAMALLLIALGLLSFRTTRATTPHELTNQSPQQAHIVEVPVVREKIVTHTVYVGKARAAHSQNHKTSGGYVAAVRSNAKAITHSEPEAGRYITHTDLSGFQPLTQMKIEIISKEKANEN